MPALECQAIEFTYPGGIHALAGVSFAVNAGESVAIVGRNGSGKTTLAKHLNGLLVPQTGAVLIDGSSIAGRDTADLAATIGLVFQNPSDQLFEGRVWDEVSFGVKQLGMSRSEVESRVESALAQVDLLAAKDTNPYDLTLGERKLVCLASILAMRPRITVLDEPTTAQDQLSVVRLVDIVKALSGQNQTVITITHDMDFVAEAFARTIVMSEGQIILDGPTADVFAQPRALEAAHVKAPAMSRLAQHFDPGSKVLTTQQMVAWIELVISNSSQKLSEPIRGRVE